MQQNFRILRNNDITPLKLDTSSLLDTPLQQNSKETSTLY